MISLLFSKALVFILLFDIVIGRPNLNTGTIPFEAVQQGDSAVVSVVYNEQSKNLIIQDGLAPVYVAKATFKNTANTTGWSLLLVDTNGTYDDHVQAEAAGMAEGFITADHISMHWQNTMAGYCSDEKEFCDKLNTFLHENTDWMQQEIKQNTEARSYWHQVSLILTQMEGLQKGYEQSKMQPAMTLQDFQMIHISGDLEDLEPALGGKKVPKSVLGSGSCSALVKLFDKNQDLAISQVTWNDFNAMLRIYKLYNFTMHRTSKGGPLISGNVQSFSGYPGSLYSGDDFTILSSGLVSQETTIGNGNSDLWKYVTTTSVLEGTRSLVANRLASTGNEWCSLFERYNSGTYNNQWMILDYNLFEVGKPLKPDTLWILEQLPGTVHMADMTVLLEKNGYWASYNVPYFPFVYNISGVEANRQKFGDWFDYNETPRAQIFRRDHVKVSDMQSLVKLMRYNDFKNDPFSKCNCTPAYSAENAISARCDLNPPTGTYPIPALGHRRHGGTDCKATNKELAKTLSQFVVAGPTSDQQPAFQWSKTEWKRPLGHPDLFNFEPRLLDWNLEHWDDQNEQFKSS